MSSEKNSSRGVWLKNSSRGVWLKLYTHCTCRWSSWCGISETDYRRTRVLWTPPDKTLAQTPPHYCWPHSPPSPSTPPQDSCPLAQIPGVCVCVCVCVCNSWFLMIKFWPPSSSLYPPFLHHGSIIQNDQSLTHTHTHTHTHSLEGIVVAKEYEEVLLEAWEQEEQVLIEKEMKVIVHSQHKWALSILTVCLYTDTILHLII